jgi:L-aspartate oxidase
MEAQGGEPVLLDATALGSAFLARRFPTLDEACRAAGYEWGREAVPITPAAHYAMGGVVTDLDGRTSLPGLWAVGETARTGVHGANRLASNSLLEAAVFADRAARSLGESGLETGAERPPRPAPSEADAGRLPRAAGHSVVDRAALQELMWTHVGLERDAAGLAAASAGLDSWQAPEVRDRRTAEDRNLLELARLTVAAALARRESRGAHFRTDAEPVAATAPVAVPTPVPAGAVAPEREAA